MKTAFAIAIITSLLIGCGTKSVSQSNSRTFSGQVFAQKSENGIELTLYDSPCATGDAKSYPYKYEMKKGSQSKVGCYSINNNTKTATLLGNDGRVLDIPFSYNQSVDQGSSQGADCGFLCRLGNALTAVGNGANEGSQRANRTLYNTPPGQPYVVGGSDKKIDLGGKFPKQTNCTSTVNGNTVTTNCN